jgi:pimeloyl-ACP methyl ester carboxylesterase
MVQTKSVNWQNRAIHYRVFGRGKMVVLLHGFGEDGTVWEPQINFLKDHFLLIIPDIPGSGKSEFVSNASIDTYAEILKVVIDHEHSEMKALADSEVQNGPQKTGGLQDEVSLIGHSMGGYIALAFAEKYPGYLNSFGLFHSSAFADPDEKKEVRKKAIEFIQTKGAGTFLKTSIPNLFTKQFAVMHPQKVERLIEKGNAFSEAALIQYYEAMIARPDRTAVLKEFKKPILFLIGEHDTAIPLESSLQQCYLPSESHVHILSQSGHMGMWEEEEKANNILLSFLLHVRSNQGSLVS